MYIHYSQFTPRPGRPFRPEAVNFAGKWRRIQQLRSIYPHLFVTGKKQEILSFVINHTHSAEVKLRILIVRCLWCYVPPDARSQC